MEPQVTVLSVATEHERRRGRGLKVLSATAKDF
jgi:hypothetical protein